MRLFATTSVIVDEAQHISYTGIYAAGRQLVTALPVENPEEAKRSVNGVVCQRISTERIRDERSDLPATN